jgi:hypothetical protein
MTAPMALNTSDSVKLGLSLASMSPVDDSIWGIVHAGSRSQRQMACCRVQRLSAFAPRKDR